MTPSRAEHLTRWSAVSLILFSALARVFTSQSRIPYWDIDPLTSWTPDTTRTPAMSLLFDALVWLAASAIIYAESRAGRNIAWKTGLLALIGCVGVALHGWIITPLTAVGGSPPTHGDFQSMILGSTWASAIVGAWALSMAARDPQVKRAAATTLLGVVIVLAAKGAMQVFIDHPRLVTEFNAKKDEMLASQGFRPGSVSARLFERRLLQAEATGWFGLSNVYGSFMAAGTAAFLALAIGASRVPRQAQSAVAKRQKPRGATACPEGQAVRRMPLSSGEPALLWLAFVIAALGLALSFSKGAIAIGLTGCTLVLLFTWMKPTEAAPEPAMTRMLRRTLRAAPIVLPLLALLAICLRGILGERIGELSLYFRWQYLLAATRIIIAHPLFGTGPTGFKDQYLLFKEPTNPEEIDSPHCLPIDWLATMGIFGAAWVILWLVWLWRTGATASAASLRAQSAVADAQRLPPRPTALAVAPLVIISASLAFSLWAEWATYVPESFVIMMLAGVSWWFIARTASRLAEADPRALNIALFGAAIVLGTHCMIDVTGVFTSSVGWVIAVGAIAVASSLPDAHTGVSTRARAKVLSDVAVVVLIPFVSYIGLRVLMQFDAQDRDSLRDAATSARDLPSSTWDAKRLDWVLYCLRERGVHAADRCDVEQIMASVLVRGAAAVLPDRADESASWAASAAHILRNSTARYPRSVTTWTRFGSLLEALAALSSITNDLSEAADAWLRAATLDPHGLTPPLHLARLNAQLNNTSEAARWAARALEIHANLHLDPLKGLTDAEKSEMEQLAGPGNPTPRRSLP